MNKTQNNEIAKIVSVLKIGSRNWRSIFIIVIAIGIVAWFVWPKQPQYVLQAGGRSYNLEAVTTPEAMVKGLGGRTSLGSDAGMLFAYEQAAPNRCFWMKDMRFPIDIIWLDQSKRVVRIEHSLSPKTYPKDFCATEPSQYVIELNAGESLRARIATGKTLTF